MVVLVKPVALPKVTLDSLQSQHGVGVIPTNMELDNGLSRGAFAVMVEGSIRSQLPQVRWWEQVVLGQSFGIGPAIIVD